MVFSTGRPGFRAGLDRGSLFPHALQNFAPKLFSWPHFGHKGSAGFATAGNGLPHSAQNLALGRFSVPHFSQEVVIGLPQPIANCVQQF
jgi:hypothetical protein